MGDGRRRSRVIVDLGSADLGLERDGTEDKSESCPVVDEMVVPCTRGRERPGCHLASFLATMK